MTQPQTNHSSVQGLALNPETVPIVWVPPGLPAVLGQIGDCQGLFLLDTAAGIELIDRRITRLAAFRPVGELCGHRLDGDALTLEVVEIDDLTIGSRSLRPLKVGIIDIDGFLPPVNTDTPFLGAVSSSFFSHHPATIDLGGNTVVFESAETLAVKQTGMGIPLTLKTRTQGVDIFAEMVISENSRGWFEIDTCSTAVIIHPRLIPARPHQTEAAQDNDKSCKDMTTGEHRRLAFAALPEMPIESRVQFKEIFYAGVLGLPFLKQICFTLDMTSQMLWIMNYP